MLIDWIHGASCQLSERFGLDLPVLSRHSDRVGELSSDLLRAFCRAEGIRQTLTLPASPEKNGIAERRIGMVMDVARTSLIHAAAPHFLWLFGVQYTAHQINLQPRVSLSETIPTLRWTGKVGDVYVFRFYHPTSRRVLSSQDVTFDESVSYYRLFPYRTASLPPLPLFLAPGTPPVDPLPPQGPAPSGVSQVDPAELVEVAVDSSAARGAEPVGVGTGGAEPRVSEPWGTEPRGAEFGGAQPACAESGGSPGVPLRPEPLSPQRLREWYARRSGRTVGAGGVAGGATGAGAAGGVAGARAAGTGAGGAAGVVLGDPGAEGTGAVSASQLQPSSPLPVPSPYFGPTRGLTERREPESRPASLVSRSVSPVRTVRAGRLVMRPRPPPVPGTHSMTLRPSTAPQRVPLPSPPASSLPDGPDPESDSLRAASPTVTRFLASTVTEPLFESCAASALVAELVDFAAAGRLDYGTSLVAESASASMCPPSVEGECALGTDVLEDRQEEFECFAAAVPHLVSMLLAPEGDPDAPDIPTPRSYAEAIEGPYSSQWQAAMDAEMATWKSTGTYVDEVPPPGANIVSGMWIFRVKRPPGSPPVFKAHYVARGFCQRQGVDFFQTFSPTLKMTTLRHNLPTGQPARGDLAVPPTWLHWVVSCRYPVESPPASLRSPPSTPWWHDTLRTTLATLGFAPSTTDPSLFLRTDTTLPPFYVLVAQRTITLTQSHMVQQVLQRFGFTCSSPQSTPLPTGHSLSAPPSDESVEPSGPYPELVGCLMYLMPCTRPDLAYTLSLLPHYVAPGRHRKVHWDAAKRVLRYLCSTSGMGLVLGGRARVVLTGHADASLVNNLATQRSSQGYIFSLGSGSVSWRSTCSSCVLSSSCEADIYAGAMAAQELRWLTYLLTDLGEAPRSPPVLYVDNKAMLALCLEH
ncbi:unnamed protein product [Closterium sp. NIES-53]